MCLDSTVDRYWGRYLIRRTSEDGYTQTSPPRQRVFEVRCVDKT